MRHFFRSRSRLYASRLAAATVLARWRAASSCSCRHLFGKDKLASGAALGPRRRQDSRRPPTYKDAPAVILFDEYLETIDAQGRAVEREAREAIRILKPQGRRNAGREVSYDADEKKINYFRAWTIASDEKQFQAQDTDFYRCGRYRHPRHALHNEKRRMVEPIHAAVA